MTTLAAGLAVDAAVPVRDALADPAMVAAHLETLLGLPVAPDARLRRAKYRVGENLRVAYDLVLPDGTLVVAARTFAAAVLDAAHARALADAPPPRVGGPPSVVLDRRHAALWWVLPADRRIREVAAVLAGGPAAAGLGLPAWSASTLVEYAPERSLTVRAAAAGSGTVAFVKAFAPGAADVRTLAARYDVVADLLTAHPDVRAPRILGVDEARCRIALEPLPGRDWGELPADELPAALARLGRAIGRLHGLPLHPALGLAPFGRLAAGRIARSAEVVATARPDLARRLAALADDLAARRPAPGVPVLLHGDCHPKNALTAPEAISLIDLDQAGSGDAAADLGSLLARLRLGVILGEHGAGDGATLAEAFLGGYGEVARLPAPASLRWHVAAALVAERAVRAVNRLLPASLERLDEIVGAAEDALAGDAEVAA